jgi:hypothetical protein
MYEENLIFFISENCFYLMKLRGGNAKLFKMPYSGSEMYCLMKKLVSDKRKATERTLKYEQKRVFVESRPLT